MECHSRLWLADMPSLAILASATFLLVATDLTTLQLHNDSDHPVDQVEAL